MKETTRIHIAKVAYDIETSAKKELEKYIGVLETYANDQELLNDIEIRITELLDERHVRAGGVITSVDVAAIRTQLGEPEEFIDTSEVHAAQPTGRSRKLYRNVDSGIAGGVLAGIGTFFGVSALWVRVAFILFLFLTAFIPVVLVYLILWIVVPPAKTAAEKLQMAGKPVTLDQMKELNMESEEVGQDTLAARRAFGVTFGIIASLFALGALFVTVIGGVALPSGMGASLFTPHVPIDYGPEWPYIVCYYLLVLSGLLLVSLLAIIAYSFFAHRFSKRTAIATIIIVIAGLVSFGTSVGLFAYRQNVMSQEIQKAMETRTVDVPDAFKNATSLKTTFNSADVQYVVDANPRMTIEAVKGTENPKVEVNGTEATVSFDGKDYGNYSKSYTKITVYGPNLERIDADGTNIGYEGGGKKIDIAANNSAAVSLKNGNFDSVTLTAMNKSNIYAQKANVTQSKVTVKDSSGVWLGVVKSLDLNVPETCANAEPGRKATVNVAGVVDRTATYNGVSKTVAVGTEIDELCSTLTVKQYDEYAPAG